MENEYTEEWEQELDQISDHIRASLEQQVSTRGDGSTDDYPICSWVDALVEMLEHRQQHDDREGASEVLDVLSMVLKTSVTAGWRHNSHNKPRGIGDNHLFSEKRLRKLVAVILVAAWAATDEQDEPDEQDEQEDSRQLAIDELCSLVLLVTCESDVAALLQVLREPDTHAAVLHVVPPPNPSIFTTPRNNSTEWPLCFLRAVLLLISPECQERAHDQRTAGNASSLATLTGTTTDAQWKDWIRDTWETKWHLNRRVHVERLLFGSAKHCDASIRRILGGFSISPVSPSPQGSATSEASAVFDLKDAHQDQGLRHGVDITFIRNGQVHPKFKGTSSADHLQIGCHHIDEALRDGYTIGLRGLQARCLPVFQLCDALQCELGQHVNANLYWTPPGEQGFEMHVDDHCVFILQLKGRKHWTLYKPLDLLPTLYQDTNVVLRESKPVLDTELILNEGDVLYIPRGVAHYADTKDLLNQSIHLTIGVEIEDSSTNGRVLHEWTRSQEEDSETSTDTSLSRKSAAIVDVFAGMSERKKQQGLMAWQLGNTEAFLSHCAAITGVDAFDIGDTIRERLETIRRHLLEERDAFLRGRAMTARAMACLHASLHSDGETTTCNPPLKGCPLPRLDDRESSKDQLPSKRLKRTR